LLVLKAFFNIFIVTNKNDSIVANTSGNANTAGAVYAPGTAIAAGIVKSSGNAKATCTVDAVGDIWGQCYKTFYSRKLRLFLIS
jgi:hypothetical protein